MAASTQFLNTILDSGVAGVSSSGGGIWVGLYSGGSVSSTNPLYRHQQITAFDVAAGALKPASARVNFAPTGFAQGGLPYDEIRLYTVGTGTQLHSITVSPAQFIANLDTHQILVRFSGS